MSPVIYLIPVIIVAFLIRAVVGQKRRRAATTHATLAAMAQRLGLAVIEGDPELNLYFLWHSDEDYRRNLCLEGRPFGRRLRWDFSDGQSIRDFVMVLEVTSSWACYLVADVNAQFPDFEATVRNPHPSLVPRRLHTTLPEVATGDPQIDAQYRIATADPRWAPALVPALRLLANQQYVHMVGQAGVVMIPITKMGLSSFVEAAEQYSHALEVLACSLEGKQPPASVIAYSPTS